MKKSIVLFMSGIALLLSNMGCISGNRILRNTPAGEDLEIHFNQETVNLWPLYYRNGNFTSILWPLFDRDNRGFAIRPFYHQDGDAAAILWPLSGWDQAAGWALNAYWGNGYCGMFPLFHTGRFHHIGPLIWKNHPEGSGYFVILPVLYYKAADRWIAGPAWRWNNSGGVFPVFLLSPGFRQFGPLWWNSANGNYGFFPAVWMIDHFNLFGPLWWNSGNGNYGFFPAIWMIDRFHMFGPLWWNSANGNYGLFPAVWKIDCFHMFGPVWWKNDGESRRHGFFPLYGHTVTPQGFRLFFGPLAMFERSGVELNWWVALGMIRYESLGGKVKQYQVWPLVSFNRDILFPPSPLLYMNRSECQDLSTALPDRSYTPFGRSFSDGRMVRNVTLGKRQSYLGMFLAFHESGTSRIWRSDAAPEKLERLRQSLIQLQTAMKGIQSTGRHVKNDPEKLRQRIADTQQNIAKYAEEFGIELSPPETVEDIAIWRKHLVENFCVEVDFFEHRTLFGLTSWFERFNQDYWGQFGLGSVIIRKNGDKSDLRVFGFLYREKHDGDSSEYLCPPFLFLQKTPERRYWSFLYRVFDYEVIDGRTSGHILFIPWGK